MNYEKHPLYVDAKARMDKVFLDRSELGLLSKAHDASHANMVAAYGSATARALTKAQGYGRELANWWGTLTAVAAQFHDIERQKNEARPHGPASADYFMSLTDEKPYSDLDETEIKAIYKAIYHHSESFGQLSELLGSPIGDKDKILPSVIVHGISVGDHVFEGSGYPILKRRSTFVGKERMQDGDLTMFAYPEESDLAVLGETMIRLHKKNPVDEYPNWLKPFAQKQHAVQYEFYQGLLENRSLTEVEAADLMLAHNFPRFSKELYDQIIGERHLSGGHFSKEGYPVLYAEIERLNAMSEDELGQLGDSADLLVDLFSKSESPEEAIKGYLESEPLVDYPEPFCRNLEGIINYDNTNPKFILSFEKDITREIRATIE